MKAYLLADIGGTNARFSLVSATTKDEIASQNYSATEYPSFIHVLKKFKTDYAENLVITSAAFGVAGPVISNRAKFTNSPWVCDKKEVCAALGIREVQIFNDFVASVLSIPHLQPNELNIIRSGRIHSEHPKIIIGPGTGLGIAALIPNSDGAFSAIPTEAGHISYAPSNEHEQNIIRHLSKFLDKGYISAEDIVSGRGLLNLYRVNCFLEKKTCTLSEPSHITQRANSGDKLCLRTMKDFSRAFGRTAGQTALAWLPLGGVYLTGGVYQKINTHFNKRIFLKAFSEHPVHKGILKQIPIYGIRTKIPAFKGLLAHLSQ